ncbi:MAG: hypothetical protein KatS3mg090_0084 [Patescibacteria group bacterium]|nr:MAG: hypothetical protein KatS3mg090_0084 [Patescibacteria group bacterium]
MQSKQLNKNSWILRFERKELFIKELNNFCVKHKITGGVFLGIGAVDYAKLAHYSVKSKKYTTKVFEQPLEVSNLSGTIGKEKDIIIHCHATLSKDDMTTIAGHLVEARVSATLELYLIKTAELKKSHDQETGLTLFNFKE